MLITICPHCRTQFYVNKEQLALAEGQVRCGRCQNIFDAQSNEAKPEVEIAAPENENYSLFEEQDLNAEPDTPIAPLPEVSIASAARGGYQFNVPHYLGNKIKLSSTETSNIDVGNSETADESGEDVSFQDFPQYYLDPENLEDTPEETSETEATDEAIKIMAADDDPEQPQHKSPSFFAKGKPSIWTVASIIALLILPTLLFPFKYFFGDKPVAPNNIVLVSSKLNTSGNQAQLQLKLKVTQATTIKNLPKMQITFQDASNQALSRIYLTPEQYLFTTKTVPTNTPIETQLNFKLKQPMTVKNTQIAWVR